MWHKAQAQPSQSGVDRPGVSAILISALPMCQWGLVHGVSDTQSRWRPSWVAGQPCVRPAGQDLVSYHLNSIVELTHSTYKYPLYPLRRYRDQKVRFSFLYCFQVHSLYSRERGEVLRVGGLSGLSGVLRVARAWKFYQNPFKLDAVFWALVRSSVGAVTEFYKFWQRTNSSVPLVYLSPDLLGLSYDIISKWVIYQS
jgi:hypothetical protein